jgi:aminopeptidase N
VRGARSLAGVAVAVAAALVAASAAGCTRPSPAPAGCPAAPADAPDGVPADPDEYLADLGNPGYDVASYHAQVTYDPAQQRLDGTVTVTATATADLSTVTLDLVGLTVDEVTVDGTPARVDRPEGKLAVHPPETVEAGETFVVEVTYGGTPRPVEAGQLGSIGFHPTEDGAFAIGQPRSASTWLPVNGHPRDKATYAIGVTVPDGLAAVSNGVLRARTSAGGRTTWCWVEETPMASYLVALAVGDYRVTTAVHDDGLPVVTAVHADLPETVDTQVARSAEIADQLARWFGPYPGSAYGGIVLGDDVGFALETQSRPTYAPGFFRGDRDASWVIVHELAHQWFGNSVSLRQWRDIWLNEGLATYAEWLWEEHRGGLSAQQSFDFLYRDADDAFWQVAPGDPGPDRLFHPAVYRRGAMTVHALRLAVGDDDFFTILREWTDRHRHGHATTADLVALAEEVSGRRLDDLFDRWLYTPQRPPRPD